MRLSGGVLGALANCSSSTQMKSASLLTAAFFIARSSSHSTCSLVLPRTRLNPYLKRSLSITTSRCTGPATARGSLVMHVTQQVNDMVARCVKLHPDRFAGVAALPQPAGVGTKVLRRGARAMRDRAGFRGLHDHPGPPAKAGWRPCAWVTSSPARRQVRDQRAHRGWRAGHCFSRPRPRPRSRSGDQSPQARVRSATWAGVRAPS